MNKFLIVLMSLLSPSSIAAQFIVDTKRDRNIPIEIYLPSDSFHCSPSAKCSVVFLSPGYGIAHTNYQFIAELLTPLGYMVVSIGHELPTDPPLAVSGNLFEMRAENWTRGAQTLHVVRRELRAKYTEYNFDSLVLVGHSNGGDISAWLFSESPSWVSRLITLDHRRVPLPRIKGVKVLSIRASDFEADRGVLPLESERLLYEICVLQIPNSRHNDFTDAGPFWLQTKIKNLVRSWLVENSCQI